MRPEITTIVLSALAIALAIAAYFKDPGLPWIGARNGLSILWFVLPRLIPALILAGLLQGLVPQEVVSRHLGREGGFGMQRIIAWEAPLMGWRFVAVRVLPSLAFPVLGGGLVRIFYHE